MDNMDCKMFLNYRRMRNIKRCNNFPTINPIDVAQHSYYVGLLTMALVDEYNTYVDEYNLGFHPIDFENQKPPMKSEVVIRKALLHDTEETFTSDISWNVKHMNEEVHEALTKAINERIDKAYKGCKTMELYHNLGKTCKEGLEGQLVNIADMTELAIFLKEEEQLGNHTLRMLRCKCIKLIQEMPLFSELFEASPLFRSMIEYLRDEFVDVHYLYDID